MSIFIQAVAEEGVDNFHRDCIWQLAMSKDDETAESELYNWYLPAKGTQQDILAYADAEVNVNDLNDDDDTHAIWKLTNTKSYSYILQSNKDFV